MTMFSVNSHHFLYFVVQAKEGERISIEFEGDFGIFMTSSHCSHWLEIRNDDLGMTGPR